MMFQPSHRFSIKMIGRARQATIRPVPAITAGKGLHAAVRRLTNIFTGVSGGGQRSASIACSNLLS